MIKVVRVEIPPAKMIVGGDGAETPPLVRSLEYPYRAPRRVGIFEKVAAYVVLVRFIVHVLRALR